MYLLLNYNNNKKLHNCFIRKIPIWSFFAINGIVSSDTWKNFYLNWLIINYLAKLN